MARRCLVARRDVDYDVDGAKTGLIWAPGLDFVSVNWGEEQD